jgi:type IV pilus assembly protein PilA
MAMQNITYGKGFTLIELMIVFAIMSILIAMLIPAYLDYIKRSKVAEALVLLGGLKMPTEEYVGSKGYMPENINVLTGMTTGKHSKDLRIVGGGPGAKAACYCITMRNGNEPGGDADLGGKVLCLGRSILSNPPEGLFGWYCDEESYIKITCVADGEYLDAVYLPSSCQ